MGFFYVSQLLLSMDLPSRVADVPSDSIPENRFPVSKQVPITNNFLVRFGIVCPFSFSVLGFCLF